MINFNILFGYNKTLYTALIHRIPTSGNFPMQYLITEINPEILNCAPVFFFHPEKETFEFTHRSELTAKIIKAIKDYCTENQLALN